ncbi:hypothetical protein ANCDUO_03160 [Ancylostoma duodenale]|uniref:Uncharacterized protein n=1 Tax=Ancylostoma duodenale TaxID=51022 RepID=A0A0C2GYD2_9BILA|nr:hypothetical protein ANCDUO_03160 [Ancylostoma duodenale]
MDQNKIRREFSKQSVNQHHAISLLEKKSMRSEQAFRRTEGVVDWPKGSTLSQGNEGGEGNKQDVGDVITRIDKVAEKNMKEEDVAAIKPLVEGRPKNPFRTKRVRREMKFRRM